MSIVMKEPMIAILFPVIFILLLIPFFAEAQGDFRKGFIVRNDNDTVQGFIDYRTPARNSKVCFFKKSNKSKKEKFNALELKGYGFYEGLYYAAKQISTGENDSTLAFVQILAKGYANLFLYHGVYYLETDRTYKLPRKNKAKIVNIEGGKSVKIEDKRYVNLLNYLLKDCGIDAKNTRYQRNELIRLVNDYNKCKNDSRILVKRLPIAKVNFLVTGGIDRTSLQSEEFSSVGFKPNSALLFGGGIEFSSPRISNKVFLFVDLFSQSKLYQTSNEYPSGYYVPLITREEILIKTMVLKTSFGIRYNFFPGNNTPYVKVGVVDYSFNDTFKNVVATTESEINNEHFVTINSYQDKWSSNDARWDKSSRIGFCMSFGYSNFMLWKLKMFAEVRFERVEGYLAPFLGTSSKSSSAIGLIGIRL